MAFEPVPIQQFVSQRYLTQPIQKIVDSWRVEPQIIVERLVEHFQDMGIYRVEPSQEQVILQSMVAQLRSSPEIMQIVIQAKTEELKRQRNRHAD